jgi:hypothetical protein
MLNLYTQKIPSNVREGMSKLTGDDCYLIKRRKKGLTGKGIQGNCHFNVQQWVDKIGGERIRGWLLYRNRSLMNKGLWIWVFHSVWKTPEGEIVDVTQDSTYEGSDFTTVWFDKSRDIDLLEGTSYNNVVVFENFNSASSFSKNVGVEALVGEPYWTTNSMSNILKISDHSGKYKWLDESFPNNIKLLESEYNCKVIDGKLVPNEGSSNKISSKIFFDYSVGG